MTYSWKSATFVSLSLAAVLAVLAPNLSGGAGSFVAATLLVPALIATPVAVRLSQTPSVVGACAGIALALCGLVVHSGISFAMLPYDLPTYAEKVQGQIEYQLAVMVLVFLSAGLRSFLSRRRRGSTHD